MKSPYFIFSNNGIQKIVLSLEDDFPVDSQEKSDTSTEDRQEKQDISKDVSKDESISSNNKQVSKKNS